MISVCLRLFFCIWIATPPWFVPTKRNLLFAAIEIRAALPPVRDRSIVLDNVTLTESLDDVIVSVFWYMYKITLVLLLPAPTSNDSVSVTLSKTIDLSL